MKKSILVIIAMATALSGCVTASGEKTPTPSVNDILTGTANALLGIPLPAEEKKPLKSYPPEKMDSECHNGWCYHVSQDSFDDNYTQFVEKGSRDAKKKMTIWCDGGRETVVSVKWEGVVGGDNYAEVDVRFDKGEKKKIQGLVYGEYSQNTSFRHYHDYLIGGFLNAKKMIMLVRKFNGVEIAHFDLTGAKKALAPLAEYCEWEL